MSNAILTMADSFGELTNPNVHYHVDPFEARFTPANIYDVLSRFRNEADKLGQLWIEPSEVGGTGKDGGTEPYFFIENRFRKLDVAITNEGVVCYHGYRLSSGPQSVPRTLITPFDYSRAYTWLLQGDEP